MGRALGPPGQLLDGAKPPPERCPGVVAVPGAAQHLLLALADDSDYEDPAWEEELASPAGQMADKVGVGAGRGWGGEQGAHRDTPMVLLVLGGFLGTAWGRGRGAGCSASPQSCWFTQMQPPCGLACTECVLVDGCSIAANIYCLDLGFLSTTHSFLRPNFCGSGLTLGAAAR